MRANGIHSWVCVCGLFCVLAVGPVLHADTASDLLELADKQDHAALTARMQDIPAEEQGDAVYVYCLALLEQDGDRANDLYHKALIAGNSERIADRAMWRIAQYYYARGYYIRARAYIRRLKADYPSSVEIERAERMLAVLDRAGIDDQDVPQAEGLPPMPEAAGGAVAREPAPTSRPELPGAGAAAAAAPQRGGKKYAVQVAFFSSESNAHKLVDRLKAMNFRDARVVSKFLLGQRGYGVWVGEFASEAEAQRLGEAMRIKGYTELFLIKEIP